MPALRVSAVGAGLAGLTLAHHLHRHGLDVTVYERDPDLTSRSPGYRLHINSTGTTALSSVLHPRLGELFAATAGIPRHGALLFDAQLTPGPARDLSDSRGIGDPASGLPEHLVVDRSTLRRILYTGLEGVVRFGARVTGYHHNPDAGVSVHLADGHRADADVLIGAHGINSGVRARRLPEHNAVDLGARHIAAKIPLIDRTRAQIPRKLYSTFTVINGPHHDVVMGDAVHAMSRPSASEPTPPCATPRSPAPNCSPQPAATNPCCPPSATTKTPCAPTDSTPYAHPRTWENASSGTIRCPLDPAIRCWTPAPQGAGLGVAVGAVERLETPSRIGDGDGRREADPRGGCVRGRDNALAA
ncbi:NAD(P)-binding protein [Streptomyces sp. NPDC002521]